MRQKILTYIWLGITIASGITLFDIYKNQRNSKDFYLFLSIFIISFLLFIIKKKHSQTRKS